jgi:protein SCO1
MKSLLKTGILALLLVVPVLVYLFLRSFGENHYRLPTFFPIETVSKKIGNKTVIDTIFHNIPPFYMLNQEGDSINMNFLKGKIWIGSFFFTRCPGICPTITSNLAKVQETFLKDDEIQMLSFTVDAPHDSSSVLKEYAEKFGINANKWQLLTNNVPNSIYNLGFYGFKLPADTLDKTLHSEKITLIDKENKIRGFYTGTNKKEIDRLITEIKILQYEYKHRDPSK